MNQSRILLTRSPAWQQWRALLDGLSQEEAAEFAGRAHDPAELLSYLESRAEGRKGGGGPPETLRKYMCDLVALPLRRFPETLREIGEAGAGKIELSKGLGKGMTPKKLHEVRAATVCSKQFETRASCLAKCEANPCKYMKSVWLAALQGCIRRYAKFPA
jgi:hypothetical protein